MGRDPKVTQLPLFDVDDLNDGTDVEVRRKSRPGYRSCVSKSQRDIPPARVPRQQTLRLSQPDE